MELGRRCKAEVAPAGGGHKVYGIPIWYSNHTTGEGQQNAKSGKKTLTLMGG